MKKKILIGVLISLFLLLMVPVNSAAESDKVGHFETVIISNSLSIRKLSERTVKIQLSSLYNNNSDIADPNFRFYPLVATPLCCYYDGDIKHSAPLLLCDQKDPSKPVTRFIEQYSPDDIYEMQLGDIGAISEEIATTFGDKSYKILAIENSSIGYEQGLMATPIASYLNIPVMIGPPSYDLIEKLDCEQVILIGENINCPESVPFVRLSGREEIISFLLEICMSKFNKVGYIALANPLDSQVINVVNESILLNENGTDYATQFGAFHKLVPISDFKFDVPDGNQIVKINLKFFPADGSIPKTDSITPNTEGYQLLFFDQDGGDFDTLPNGESSSLFYTESNAYDDWEAYYELDVIDNPGPHYIKINSYGNLDKIWNLKISAEELDANIRPQAPFLSTLSPYLASNYQGIVLADSSFCENIKGKIGNINRRYNVTLNEEAINAACNDNKYTDSILDETFIQMKSQGLFESYISKSPYLGIIADNNMVPMYYYPSEEYRQFYSYEGTYQPSDNLLADINGDGYNLSTSLELAVGRLMGWDAQDVSALICRSLFYNKIIDDFDGLKNSDWKDSVTMCMGVALQERIIPSQRLSYMKINSMFRKSGYAIFSKTYGFQKVKYIEELLENMEKSNLIQNQGHGRYYRVEYFYPLTFTFYGLFLKLFYPQKQQSQYAVCNVKDMELGPSTMAITGCIAGSTDGIPLRCTNSMATIHAGCNALFINLRCPSGPLAIKGRLREIISKKESLYYYDELLDFWFEEIVKKDASVGFACKNSKNSLTQKYMELDWWNKYLKINPNEYERLVESYVHYNLYGDPAFNPYTLT